MRLGAGIGLREQNNGIGWERPSSLPYSENSCQTVFPHLGF